MVKLQINFKSLEWWYWYVTLIAMIIGLLGVVHGEKVVMRRKPWTHEYIKTDGVAERIELIKCVVGDDGRMMRAMTELGVEGFVIEGVLRDGVEEIGDEVC